MKVFCVTGTHSSGKTTTIEKIIGELKKRGYRVGSVKDIHSETFSLDTPGKNTWRHKEAGSEIVVARGISETNVMMPGRFDIAEVLKWFDQDFVIIEGGRCEKFPKILTAKDKSEIDERLDGSVFAVSGMISSQYHETEVPVINALTGIGRLTDLIELHAAEYGGDSFV